MIKPRFILCLMLTMGVYQTSVANPGIYDQLSKDLDSLESVLNNEIFIEESTRPYSQENRSVSSSSEKVQEQDQKARLPRLKDKFIEWSSFLTGPFLSRFNYLRNPFFKGMDFDEEIKFFQDLDIDVEAIVRAESEMEAAAMIAAIESKYDNILDDLYCKSTYPTEGKLNALELKKQAEINQVMRKCKRTELNSEELEKYFLSQANIPEENVSQRKEGYGKVTTATQLLATIAVGFMAGLSLENLNN